MFCLFCDLHMLAQTTNSGSNNPTMAAEMEKMFGEAEQSVEWNSGSNQIKCYAHKLAVTVKDGLKALGLTTGHTKPTTKPGPAPKVLHQKLDTPSIVVEAPSDDEDEPEEDDPDLAFENAEDLTASEAAIDHPDLSSADEDNDQLLPPQILDVGIDNVDDLLPLAVSKVRKALIFYYKFCNVY